jgi:hypothetical protein
MATINDLLYNYQETNEFVCSDGRMSVNGICQVDQPDSVDTAKITKEIIEKSSDGGEDLKKILENEKKIKDRKILKDLEGTSDYYPELGKEKGKFEWDMDKENKIEGYTTTINNNINAYNNFIEENLGIPSDVQNAVRVGSTVAGIAQGGILMAVAPWAIPVLAGGAINRAERERIEKITDQDKQGDIQTVDMMTYDVPGYGEEGFNIHSDAGDKPDFRGTNQDQGVTSDAGFDQSSDGGYQQSRGSHHF